MHPSYLPIPMPQGMSVPPQAPEVNMIGFLITTIIYKSPCHLKQPFYFPPRVKNIFLLMKTENVISGEGITSKASPFKKFDS